MIFVLFFMISLIEPEDVSAQEQEIISDDVNVLINKGAALNQLGQYAEAIEYYDKALAIEPNHEGALINKGFALHNLGQYNQAIEYYDKALAMEPNDVNR